MEHIKNILKYGIVLHSYGLIIEAYISINNNQSKNLYAFILLTSILFAIGSEGIRLLANRKPHQQYPNDTLFLN